MTTLAVILIALLTSLFLVHRIRRIATDRKIGAMPDARMIHTRFKPVLGGLGILGGLLAGIVLANLIGVLPVDIWIDQGHIWGGLLVIVLTGLIDDIRGISPTQKFAGEFVAASVAAAGGCHIAAFYGPVGAELSLGWFSFPFTVLWIMFVINAVNLMDGLDGLAGGVSLITLAGFYFIAAMSGNLFLCVMAAALIGALLGFLRYNYHPASIFMGDAGSLMLGFLLACFSIEALKVAGSQKILFLASLVVLGMPVTDTLISFFRRMGRGEHPFKADKEHIHHRLLRLGVGHLDTVWLIYYSTIVYVLFGILMTAYMEIVSVLLFCVGFLLSIFWAWRLGYLETRSLISFGVDEAPAAASQRPPIRINRIWHQIAIFLGDIFATIAALYVTHWFRFQSGIVNATGAKSLEDYLQDPVVLVISGIWVLLFWLNGLYKMSWDVSRFDKSVRVTRVISFAVLLLLVLLNIDLFVNPATKDPFNQSQLTTLAIYWLMMVGWVNAIRLLIIEVEKRLHIFEYRFKNTLIIGANRKAKNIVRDIAGNPHLLYRIVGLVDRRQPDEPLENIPYVGGYEDLPELIRNMSVEEIIITLDETRRQDMLNITAACDRLQVVVKNLPAMRSFVHGGAGELAGHGLVRVFPEQMVLWQWLIKRLVDISFSLTVGLITMPIWLVLIILVKLRLDKPLIVRRSILGRNGRIFRLYGFVLQRSDFRGKGMNGLERFLAKSQLFKFPQLLNILRGDMSVVGPRPESPEWYRENKNELKLLHRRLRVRPGLTGLAQVKYRFDRSQEDMRERVKYDIYYVENLSILLDLRIILRSVLLFISNRKPSSRD